MDKQLFLVIGGYRVRRTHAAAMGIMATGLFALLVSQFRKAPGLAQSEAKIRTLHPRVQKLARRFLKRAAQVGIPLVVASAHRSNSEQQKLYDQGRSSVGKIVTNAKPGGSWHNYGLAFDVAVLKNGQPTWPEDSALWNRIGAIGTKVGLNWGASFGDRPHFDWHPGLTIAQAKAGKKVTV